MPWNHTGSVVVIVAQQFNPTVFRERWLESIGVLSDQDLQEGSIFTDSLVQVRSRYFHMLVLPPQLQFVPAVPAEDQQRLILDKLNKIVSELPHTPFRGLGLNFNWHLRTPERDARSLSRQLFTAPDRPLYRHFEDGEPCFGAYLSKAFGPFRLKLDIKPVIVNEDGTPEHEIMFAFNFHSELAEGGVDLLREQLRRWDEVRQEAERIIDSVEPRH